MRIHRACVKTRVPPIISLSVVGGKLPTVPKIAHESYAKVPYRKASYLYTFRFKSFMVWSRSMQLTRATINITNFNAFAGLDSG